MPTVRRALPLLPSLVLLLFGPPLPQVSMSSADITPVSPPAMSTRCVLDLGFFGADAVDIPAAANILECLFELLPLDELEEPGLALVLLLLLVIWSHE